MSASQQQPFALRAVLTVLVFAAAIGSVKTANMLIPGTILSEFPYIIEFFVAIAVLGLADLVLTKLP